MSEQRDDLPSRRDDLPGFNQPVFNAPTARAFENGIGDECLDLFDLCCGEFDGRRGAGDLGICSFPYRSRSLLFRLVGIELLLIDYLLFRQPERSVELFLAQRVVYLALLCYGYRNLALMLSPLLSSLRLMEMCPKHGGIYLGQHLTRFNRVAFLDQHRLDAPRLLGCDIHFCRLDAPVSRGKLWREFLNPQMLP